ncbi:AF1514 family protein [Chloroflexota bacterium]
METLRLQQGDDIEFDRAQAVAIAEADKYLTDPMVLSWLNRKTGRHSPDVDCCQEEGKETWEIYAESRGGILRVEIVDQYVFIFREGLPAVVDRAVQKQELFQLISHFPFN